MPNIVTWMRGKDVAYFVPFFAGCPDVRLRDAAREAIDLSQMDGLLLTGGSDVAAEFLKQNIPDPSLIRSPDRQRDVWEFAAIEAALARGLPILAICKGMQTLNVALDGTLHLDIAGHNFPEQKASDVQPLRTDRHARYRFERVNSSHHQAIDLLGHGLEVEAWCASDDIVEQVRLRNYPFAIAVQYHPERGTIYDQLFRDFIEQTRASGERRGGFDNTSSAPL